MRSFLQRGRSLANRLFGRPLPLPTKQENFQIELLRKNIEAWPKVHTEGLSEADEHWAMDRIKLREMIQSADPRNFLSWNVLTQAMVHEADIREFRAIKSSPYWDQWKEKLSEVKTGNPKPYSAFPASSGNLIHQAYHLLQLTERTRFTVGSMDQIVEFGGGYGSMCRLIHQLGFTGNYVIYDLPEYNALQNYYLTASIPEFQTSLNSLANGSGIILISDLEKLEKQLNENLGSRCFIATWSISETSLSLRKKILTIIDKANIRFFLIAYQDKFNEVDNVNYFMDFKNKRADYAWRDFEIEHLPGNRYLIGERK